MKPEDRKIISNLLETLRPQEFLVVADSDMFTCKEIRYLDEDYISLIGILSPEIIAIHKIEITIPKLNIQLIIQKIKPKLSKFTGVCIK
jgi:transposase